MRLKIKNKYIIISKEKSKTVLKPNVKGAVFEMKKLLCLIFSLIMTVAAVSCGNGGKLSDEELQELCSWRWESVVDVMQFTHDGRILCNFQFLHESDSRYSIEDGKITMYSEAFPEDAMTFDFRMEDGKMYIGEVEYRKLEEVEDPSLEISENIGNDNAGTEEK